MVINDGKPVVWLFLYIRYLNKKPGQVLNKLVWLRKA